MDFSTLIQFRSMFESLSKTKEFREIQINNKSSILQIISYIKNSRKKFKALATQFLIEKDLYMHNDKLRSEKCFKESELKTITQLKKAIQDFISISNSPSRS